MELHKFICTVCGAPLGEELAKAKKGIVICPYCKNTYTVPTKNDDDIMTMLQIGQHELDLCRFDDAIMSFKKLIDRDSSQAESYFNLALAEYNVQYLKDEINNRLQPICHKINETSFTKNKNYLSALKLATEEQLTEYKKKAMEIDQVNDEFYRLKEEGINYDTFICTKVTDDSGNKTADFGFASDIYFALIKKGYKPFFSEYSLKDAVGSDYEAHILYALKSAKSMLVVCTNEEYLSTKWVKNEYSRFIKLMEDEEKDPNAITIVFKEKPIEKLPGKKGKIQGICLNKVDTLEMIEGFISKYIKDKKTTATKTSAKKQVTNKTIQETEEAAKKGDANAQYQLGLSYSNGDGVEKNPQKAFYWYKKSAKQGNKDAITSVGLCYEKGQGVSQSYKKALSYYKKLAKKGDPNSQYTVGYFYDHSKGVPFNFKKAYRWYKKAAILGNAQAQYMLAINFYAGGVVVKRDFLTAANFLEQAAEQGYAPAQKELADYYYDGKGVEKDYYKAAYWYEQAANQNDADACFALANKIYYKMKGTNLSGREATEKADYWSNKASENGYHSK